MAEHLRGASEGVEGVTMAPEDHPFVKRVRAEREMVAAVNACRSIFFVELAGTSPQAIAAWFRRIPSGVQKHNEVRILRERLDQAGRIAKLASNGSHRGAMTGEHLRRDAIEESVRLVTSAARRVREAHPESLRVKSSRGNFGLGHRPDLEAHYANPTQRE